MNMTEYKLIPMSEITDEARELAVLWSENMKDDFISQKHKLASDIMNYAESIAKERAVEILKWVARYEIHDDHSGTDGITLIDGVYYWDGDTDGDAPLSEEKIYEIFTGEDTFLAEQRKEGAE